MQPKLHLRIFQADMDLDPHRETQVPIDDLTVLYLVQNSIGLLHMIFHSLVIHPETAVTDISPGQYLRTLYN